MYKNIFKATIALTLFTSGLAVTALNSHQSTTVQAKSKEHAIADGVLKTKRPIKVAYIKMMDQPWKNHKIGETVIPKGTVIHAFHKFTEGCAWVVYGGNVKLTRTVWTSANLNHKNVQQLKKQDVYGHLPKKWID